ncbi:hypothetical protein KCP73_07315 [Salmonella enterica subsp. enterica]|nr:hypothetical protein KCP73_07315 [Salmonella enterica subsp. enterica]
MSSPLRDEATKARKRGQRQQQGSGPFCGQGAMLQCPVILLSAIADSKR